MADGVVIDFHGLDEDLKKVVQEYPDETAKFLLKEARQWKKDCNDKGYGKYSGHDVDSMTGFGKRPKHIKPIGQMWKNVKVENSLHQLNAVEIQNKSNIFHLVENGHVKYFMGNGPLGFVSGKHWAERTREEYQEKFPEDVQDYVDKMLGRHNL